MTPEAIIIRVLPKSLEVVATRVWNAVLYFQAPGLDVYVSGKLPPARYAQVSNLALNECIGRNIPAVALRNVRRAVPARKKAIPAKQLKLPGMEK